MKALLLVIPVSFLVAGCAQLTPRPLQPDEIRDASREDRVAVRKEVPPVGATLTVSEAVARALKFNLERRARLMEQALAAQQFDASRYDMLPRLLASAGYSVRDNDRISYSIDSVTGLPSLANPSISQERQRSLYQLELSWNLLDYGLARYASEQAGDRLLIATERRRKATHQLIQDVRVAFWRAASAQTLQDEVRANIRLAESAIEDSKTAEFERLRTPLDNLRYQRQLTENMRLLESIQQELATARFELAALINSPIVLQTRLVVDRELPSDLLQTPAEAMEEQALEQNPDLREQLYQRRVSANEVRKVIARAFPNVSFTIGPRHDADKFLVNQSWSEAGAQISYNLLGLLALPAQKRAAEAGVALMEQRRLAAHVATVAQVHIAREQVASARDLFNRTHALWVLDDKIAKMQAAREQAQAGSKLETVAARTSTIISLLRRYQALAQLHSAQSRLQATLGIDPLPESSDDLTIEQIGKRVEDQLKF